MKLNFSTSTNTLWIAYMDNLMLTNLCQSGAVELANKKAFSSSNIWPEPSPLNNINLFDFLGT